MSIYGDDVYANLGPDGRPMTLAEVAAKQQAESSASFAGDSETIETDDSSYRSGAEDISEASEEESEVTWEPPAVARADALPKGSSEVPKRKRSSSAASGAPRLKASEHAGKIIYSDDTYEWRVPGPATNEMWGDPGIRFRGKRSVLRTGGLEPQRTAKARERRFISFIRRHEETVRNLGDLQVKACLRVSRTDPVKVEAIMRTGARAPTLTCLPPLGAFSPVPTASYLVKPLGTASRLLPVALLQLEYEKNSANITMPSLPNEGIEVLSGAPVCYIGKEARYEKERAELRQQRLKNPLWTETKQFNIHATHGPPGSYLRLSAQEVVMGHILFADLVALVTPTGPEQFLPPMASFFDIGRASLTATALPCWSAYALPPDLDNADQAWVRDRVDCILAAPVHPSGRPTESLLAVILDSTRSVRENVVMEYLIAYLVWRTRILKDFLLGIMAMAAIASRGSKTVYLCSNTSENPCVKDGKMRAEDMFRVTGSRITDPAAHMAFTLYERQSFEHYAASLMIWNMIGRKCTFNASMRKEGHRASPRVYCKAVAPFEVLRDAPSLTSDAWTKTIFPEVYAWTRYPVLAHHFIPGEGSTDLSVTPPAAAGEGQPVKRAKVSGAPQTVGVSEDVEACSRGKIPRSYHNPYLVVKSKELIENQDVQIAVRLFDEAFTFVTPEEALTRDPSHIFNSAAVHMVLDTMKREKLTNTKKFRIRAITLLIAAQRTEMRGALKYNNPHQWFMWKMNPDSEVARSIERARERQDIKDLQERRGGDDKSEVAPISEFYTRA